MGIAGDGPCVRTGLRPRPSLTYEPPVRIADIGVAVHPGQHQFVAYRTADKEIVAASHDVLAIIAAARLLSL